MAEILYPYGYAGTKLTMSQLKAKTTWINAHPEFQRRLEAMLVAGQGRLGVGTIWRSSATQEKTFLERHYVVSSGGCCVFAGKRYQKKSGVAHAAPPGKSFHEGTVYGKAAAMDAIGDLNWMHVIEGAYGFKDFRYVGNEPWHIQFLELPNSVTQWKAAGSPPPKKWILPGTGPEPEPIPPTPTPTPPPTNWAVELMKVMPIVIKGNQGVRVKRVQHFLALAGEFDATNMANFDGMFGSGTEGAVKRFQTSHKITADGIVDSEVWDLFCEASNGIPGLVKGNTGLDVQRMQRMLSANGQMDPSNQGNFDGQFGSGTESAVKKFQSAKGLNADGKCGQKTWTSLLNG